MRLEKELGPTQGRVRIGTVLCPGEDLGWWRTLGSDYSSGWCLGFGLFWGSSPHTHMTPSKSQPLPTPHTPLFPLPHPPGPGLGSTCSTEGSGCGAGRPAKKKRKKSQELLVQLVPLGSATPREEDPVSGAASSFPKPQLFSPAQSLAREAAAGLAQYQDRKDLGPGPRDLSKQKWGPWATLVTPPRQSEKWG